jgi:hypothetical protein
MGEWARSRSRRGRGIVFPTCGEGGGDARGIARVGVVTSTSPTANGASAGSLHQGRMAIGVNVLLVSDASLRRRASDGGERG